MGECTGRADRSGVNWPALLASLVFLAVASVGFSGDPWWLLNAGVTWMIAGVVAVIGVGMVVSTIPKLKPGKGSPPKN